MAALRFPSTVKQGDLYSVHSVDDGLELYFSYALHSLLSLTMTKLPPVREREAVAATAVMSFLSLEACINRLYFETFVEKESPVEPLPTAHARSLSHIKREWTGMSVREKWLLLPSILTEEPFEAGRPPFSYFEEFVKFRNRLVHPKASISEMKVRATHVRNGENSRQVSGSVASYAVDAPVASKLFPRTHFSTTFIGLSPSDAEKCVEIAFRMRMSLSKKIFQIPQPSFLAYPDMYPTIKMKDKDKFFIGEQLGQFIFDNLTIHFGPFE